MYKIDLVNINELKLNPINTRQHTDKDINNLIKSIQRFGFRNPLVCSRDNIVLVGNGRLTAAKQMGIEELPVHYVDFNEKDAQAFAIMDNRSSELSTWDLEYLVPQLEELKLDDMLEYSGFSELDLDDLNKDLELEKNKDLEAEEDDFDESKVEENKYKVEFGDIYLLGRHRLMCGDSTNKEYVYKLMDGKKADMVFTDPPYGVKYEQGKFTGAKVNNKFKVIANDDLQGNDLCNFIINVFDNDIYKEGCSFYVCSPPLTESMAILYGLIESNIHIQGQLIWVKNQFILGRADYHWQHEVIWYGYKGKDHYFVDDRTQSTIWEIHKDSHSNYEHPTQKPIKLSSKAINNSSKENDLVLDLFLGSGSTLIACEQLNRSCSGMELDPHYCSVIIDRFHRLKPNIEIKRIRNGVEDKMNI